MNTTRIYLVRHGATQLTAEDRFSGASGVDLSEEGRWQAERLGDRLAREGVHAIYTSPLSRTMDTARIITRICGCGDPTPMDGLREISHGRWEGLTRSEVEERFGGEYASWQEDPFTFAPEGGESGVAVLARSLPVLREIVTRHRQQRVLVVSHKATIRILISSLLGFDARGYRDRLDQAPACLNVLDFRDAVHARLMLFNDTSHYSERPREATQSLSKWWDQA
ncbi:MAG TPA: histidine phosphatase family protein [Thermoanaerobaculia bacterium]